jgi:hypothetical protein
VVVTTWEITVKLILALLVASMPLVANAHVLIAADCYAEAAMVKTFTEAKLRGVTEQQLVEVVTGKDGLTDNLFQDYTLRNLRIVYLTTVNPTVAYYKALNACLVE